MIQIDLSNIRWSFSSLEQYDSCPYAFYLNKIEKCDDRVGNFYAENGSICHEIFADIALGKMSVDDAPGEYEQRFELICNMAKENIMDSTFEKIITYLCESQGIDDKYEVMFVEEKLEFKVGKYNFIGFVDLVVKNKETGEVIIVDHKSSPYLFKKSGGVLKNQMENYNKYKKQMCIYIYALKQIYDVRVDKMAVHHFKDNGKISVIDFDEESVESAVSWAIETIESIEKDQEFNPCKSFMRCSQLCDFRECCEYLQEEEDE